MNTYSKQDSPCIGICSTVYGDDVCRGCKRFNEEIIDWNRFQQAQKDKVYVRIDTLITKVMQDKVSVFAPDLLIQKLQRHAVHYRTDDTPYGHVFVLLREGAEKMREPRAYGFRVLPPYVKLSLPELIRQIDDEYYQLSLEHFETT